jgi:bis(5'-nucleosyl)-tetraphosphatase (symmetrical)
MATFAIGDLQGCFASLRHILRVIGFNAERDRLWLVGDLVNRGPDSLATLRYVKSLGDRAVTVLGNHDLHTLMVAEGYARIHGGDTIDELLAAPDAGELLAWLRRQKMFHAEGEYALVHAGLLPSWSISKALELAHELEEVLRGPNHRDFMAQMYGNQPDRWDDALSGNERMRVITNAMTRLRLCTAEGVMEFAHKGKPADIPPGFMPWFDVPQRLSRGTTIICGHWAALGLLQRPDLLSIDSGCVWGRELSAVRLEDRKVFQVSCAQLAGAASGQ